MSRRRPSDRDPRGHSQRQLRVGELIRHAIADILARDHGFCLRHLTVRDSGA